MRTIKQTVVLFLGAAPVLALAAGGPHWDYDGKEGPEHWGKMHKDFATCGLGHKQSPINIADTSFAAGNLAANITNVTGVPVDANVAASLRATCPDLPMPMMPRRPLFVAIISTASTKS